MTYLLLIDGYNVVAPIAPPGRNPDPRWLERERKQFVDRLIKHLDAKIRSRTCVVFDAANPPPDRPSQFSEEGIEIRFAVNYPEADDLLEEMIAAHSSPKRLAVVSSDIRVQTAAKRRGCTPFESQPWLDRLLEGELQLAIPKPSKKTRKDDDQKPRRTSTEEVETWMKEFGFDD